MSAARSLTWLSSEYSAGLMLYNPCEFIGFSEALFLELCIAPIQPVEFHLLGSKNQGENVWAVSRLEFSADFNHGEYTKSWTAKSFFGRGAQERRCPRWPHVEEDLNLPGIVAASL